jgi:hypothetical protein
MMGTSKPSVARVARDKIRTDTAVYDGLTMIGRLEPAGDGIRCLVVHGPDDDGCMIGTAATFKEARQLIRSALPRGNHAVISRETFNPTLTGI